MKNLSFFILGLVFFASACRQNVSEKSKGHEVPKMYEASELALIMRQMDGVLREMRTALIQGIIPVDTVPSYTLLHHAEATNPDELEASFHLMADAFMRQVQTMHMAKDHATYQAEFDKTVQACMNCHNSYCSGPLDRIRKLSITPAGSF